MNINGFSRAINVVTTTADVVDTAKDIKDIKDGNKGVTGFEIILDVFQQLFKAVWWVVKVVFKIHVWFFKITVLMLELAGGGSNNKNSSSGGFFILTKEQKHNIDSNGLSRSEAINNPNW